MSFKPLKLKIKYLTDTNLIYFFLQIRLLHKKVKRSVPWIPPRSKFEGNASAIASRGFVNKFKNICFYKTIINLNHH